MTESDYGKESRVREYILRDPLVRAWYEIYRRNDKTFEEGLLDLVDLLIFSKDETFNKLLECGQHRPLFIERAK